ncbi:MAG TPA: gliding motility lipoprotein GldD, partial [Flavobacterium sp.]
MLRIKKEGKEQNLDSIIGMVFMVLGLLLFTACKDDVFPKPASHLRLDYPVAKYVDFENQCPFSFEMNSNAVIKGETDCGFA